jgi:hypothetical protein
MGNLSEQSRLIVVGILSFALGLVLASLWFVSQGNTNEPTGMSSETDTVSDSTMEDTNSTSETDMERAPIQTGDSSVTVNDQASGKGVFFANGVFENPSWVVVHEMRGMDVGNALGAAYVVPEMHEGVVQLLRATVPNQTYTVRIYSDNGNRVFELNDDALLIDAQGEPISDTFLTH